MNYQDLEYALSVSRISSHKIKAALKAHLVEGRIKAEAADLAGVDRSLLTKRVNRVKEIHFNHVSHNRRQGLIA